MNGAAVVNPKEAGERIAVLEERQDRMREEFDEIKDGIHDIQRTLSKQRGFWAGVTFAATIVAFFLKDIWHKLAGS